MVVNKEDMLNKRDLRSIREIVKEEAGVKIDGLRLEFSEVIAESILPKFDDVYARFDQAYERFDQIEANLEKMDDKIDLIAANTVRKSELTVALADLRRKRKPRST